MRRVDVWSLVWLGSQVAAGAVLAAMSIITFGQTDQRDIDPVRAVPARWESADPAVMLAWVEHERAAAKERQGQRTDIVEHVPQCSMGRARDQSGAAVGVSESQLTAGRRIGDTARP